MKHTIEKISDEIAEFGDGTTEFHTRDIQSLLDHITELENKCSAIDYLGKQNKGLHHDRIEENLLMKEYDWNNAEKTFAFSWCQKANILESLLFNNKFKFGIKITNEIRVSVATIVQWLGSNMGWEFLNSTLEKEGYKIVKIENPIFDPSHLRIDKTHNVKISDYKKACCMGEIISAPVRFEDENQKIEIHGVNYPIDYTKFHKILSEFDCEILYDNITNILTAKFKPL